MPVAIASLAFLLSVAGLLILRPPTWLLRRLSRHYLGTLFIADTESHALALTIDDSPHPEVTPGILNVLRRHQVRATFFIIGENAARYPEILAAIRTDGHELANHMYRDRRTIHLGADEFERGAARTDALIATAGAIKWCRPGGGTLSRRLAGLMRRHGYTPCLASAYPLDLHLGGTVARLQFLANVRPGAILVLHDGAANRRRTIGVLENVLPRVVKRGYRFVTVSELVAIADTETSGGKGAGG